MRGDTDRHTQRRRLLLILLGLLVILATALLADQLGSGAASVFAGLIAAGVLEAVVSSRTDAS